MKKEFRPLILETAEGYREFINCYEIVTVTHCPVGDNYVVDATSKVGIAISNEAGDILMQLLVDPLFFSSDSIDQINLIKNNGSMQSQ